MATYRTVITDEGASLIAAAVVSGEPLIIAQAGVGDANGEYYVPTQSQTELRHECWRGEVSAAYTNSEYPNVIDVQVAIPADAESFTAREIALYDEDGTMIAVGNLPPTERVTAGLGVTGRLTLWMHIAVQDAGAVEFSIVPSTQVLSGFSMTINAADWTVLSDPEEGFEYEYVLSYSPIGADMVPEVVISEDSLQTAVDAGLCQVAQTFDGGLRLLAREAPAAAINARCYLIGKGFDGEEIAIPDWDDVQHKPTTLAGYGITDAATHAEVVALQAAVGSPLLAATAAAMTDTDKIYVYTGSETGYTAGNWYYHNGTAWVSGGVYNAVAVATDTELVVSGMAADAKAAGDELKKAVQSSLLYIQASNTGGYSNADDFPANRIINISSNITATHVANLPSYGEASYVLTLTYNPASVYSAQVFFGRDTTAVRLKLLSGWTAWRIEANIADVLKYAAITASSYDSLAAVPENVISALNFTTASWSDVPEGAQYGILLSSKVSANYKLQMVLEYGDSKRIWWRIVNRTSPYGTLVDWQGAAMLPDLQTVQSFCNKLILSVSSYVAEKDITALSEITENVIMLASQANFNDSPYYSPIFFNKRYSTNYDIQFALKASSGQLVYRIINRSTGATYQDWTVPSLLEAYRVLSVGDSICYGSRNGHKGFLGDLNLVRENASYPGACLANIRMSTANHLCIYQQLIDFSEAEENTGYTPDVIAADGGVNDYFYNAPLGTVPAHPAVSAEEAAALDKSTLLGGLEYLFYLMITKYPSAQRFFVAAHRIKTWPWTAHFTGGYTQTEMNEAIAEVCRLYGVELIDVFNRSVINSAFSQYVSPVDYDTDHTVTDRYYVNSDGIHPLALGYREGYVPLVREALRTATRKPPITEFSGNVVRFGQGTGVPLQSVITQIEHGNMTAARIAVTKKNMLIRPYLHDDTWESRGITFTVQENGTVTASGTLSSKAESTAQPYVLLQRIWLQPGVIYSISHGCSHPRAFCVAYFRDYANTRNITPDGWIVDTNRAMSATYVSCLNSGAFRAKRTFYVNEPCALDFQLRFDPDTEAQTITDVVFKPMLYVGGEGVDWDTAPTWEQATGEIITIPFGVTVDEGELNVTTGELTVTQPEAATYQLEPTEVTTLNGFNQIVADTGAISVVRRA